MKKLKKWTVMLTAVFVMLMVSQRAMDVLAANGDIASGKDKNITWVIDGSGKLTVHGTGDFTDGVPWDAYRLRITSAVVQVTGMTDASELFSGCSNLKSVDLSGFDTSKVNDMQLMFYACSSLSSLDLSRLNTANVTKMLDMFMGCNSLTSLDLSHFNTSNVTDMRFMFSDCSNLSSINISSFDTSNVVDMRYMFKGCSSLANLDLSHFDTSKVAHIEHMFDNCNNLVSLNVSSFDTSNVTDIYAMFQGCNSLSTLDLSHFDISKLKIPENSISIFSGCINLSTIYTPCNLKASITLPVKTREIWYLEDGTEISELPKNFTNSVKITRSQNIGDIANGTSNHITWMIDDKGKLTVNGTGDYVKDLNSGLAPWGVYRESIISAEVNVTGMTDASYMFSGCENLVSLDLSHFNTLNVTNMKGMFGGCENLVSLDLSHFDTSNVINMENMFINCGVQHLNLCNFDTSNVMNMNGMFCGCDSSSINLSSFNTNNVTDMSKMFSWCDSLLNLDLSSFNTENVTDMSEMFDGCEVLRNLNLSSFNTKDVTNMSSMFNVCLSLTSLDLKGFNTENVTDMSSMFSNCSSLKSLNLSSFNTENVTDMSLMFNNCSSLTSLDLSNFNTEYVWGLNMFDYCEKLISINTPYNVEESVELPGTGWHLPDGTEITELPKNLEYSILITRQLPDNTGDNNTNNGDSNNNQDNNTNNGDSNNNQDDNTNNDQNTPPDNTWSWIGDKDPDQPGSTSGVIDGTGSTQDITSYGPRLLAVQPTAYNKIQLSWDAVPGAKSYEIFYSTSPDSGFKRLTNAKKTTYRFSKAKCGVTYYFQMRVCQKGAKSAFDPVSYAKTELMGAPSLQVKKTSYNSVTLRWSKVAGAKKYEIFYADSMGGSWQSLGLKGGTSFTHKKLVTGATYYYQIRPVRDSFGGNWSNGVSASTYLENVSKLKVKAVGADRMRLTWKKVKGATQYVILRSNSADGTCEVIAHTNKPSYMDTGLSGGTTYFYKVYAVSGPYKTKETAPVGQTTKTVKK